MKIRVDGTAAELAIITARLDGDIVKIKGSDPPKAGIYRRYFELKLTPRNGETSSKINALTCGNPPSVVK